MEIACVLCNTRMETTKEDVYVTVRWMLKEILQLNQETANEVPRICRLCATCWTGLTQKPSVDDYYWIYDKTI